MFADPLTERLAGFVREIGIDVRAAELPDDTFLPGLDIRDGAILVDERRLAHPGDILHEAGHLAVTDAAERNAPTLAPSDGRAGHRALSAHVALAPLKSPRSPF
jgi:hypothetical protein